MKHLTIEEKKSKQYGVKTAGQAAIKDIDLNKRIVTGFFNTNNYFDSDADVLLSGSSKNSIDQHGVNSTAVRKIKHALNHDLGKLVGKIEVLDEKEIDGIRGIYFETRMAKTTLGNDTLINYQEGVYDNHSIGFRYLDLEFVDSDSDKFQSYLDLLINPEDAEKRGYLYAVKEIELYEGSTVAIGANELTPFLGVKSNNPELIQLKLIDKISIIEKQLKNGGQSDSTLYDFSIQLRQIKQLLKETNSNENKPAPKEKGSSAFDVSKGIDKIQLF